MRLWLKIVVSRGGESCELEHGSIYAIEVPGKGNLPRRINALFAAGPRSLYQLGQDPPPGSRSKRGEAQRSAAAIALAKVPETCRAKCEILGQCARRKDPDNKYRDQCVALDAPSCAASYRCARFGACALSHSAKGRPICAATSASCRRASSCRRIGWCGLLAASRADSRAPLPARCAPTRTEHCAASRACRTNGECALVGSTCRPREASHCARSRHCAEYGWCSLSGGRCVAAATAQCKRSRRCRTWGSCRLDAKNGDCTR